MLIYKLIIIFKLGVKLLYSSSKVIKLYILFESIFINHIPIELSSYF